MSQPPATAAYPTLSGSITRHFRLLLGLALGLALLLGVLAIATTPAATAQGRLGLAFPAPGNVLLPVPTGDQSLKRYIAQRAEFAESDEVVAQVAGETGLAGGEIRRRLTVTPTASSNGLDFVVEAGSASDAEALASAAMDAYRDRTLVETTRRSEELAQAQRESGLPNSALRTMAELAAFGDGVEFTTSPSEESTQTRGLPWRELLIGLLAGFGLGALLLYTLDLIQHRRMATVEEPEGT